MNVLVTESVVGFDAYGILNSVLDHGLRMNFE